MDSRDARYATALTNIVEYINQCKMVKQWVRKELQIYWLFVDGEGKVSILSQMTNYSMKFCNQLNGTDRLYKRLI